MTAPAAAASETTSGEIDPIDSLDLSGDTLSPSQGHIPEHMMLDGPPGPDTTAEADTKAPEVEAPSASQEPTLPEGYTKDARGRIHRPDGTVASKDEVASFATAAPQSQAATETKAEKFRYRHNGENHELDGFEYDPATGRVTVAPEHVSVLRDAMNARHVLSEGRDINAKLRGEVDSLRGQLEQRNGASTETEARAKALIDHYTNILGEQDEAKALEAFFRLRSDYPVLLAKAGEQFWKQRATSGQPASPKAQPTARPAEAPAAALPAREIAVKQTTESVEQLKLDHAFRDLTPEHWKQLTARYERTPYAFLRPATAEEATQYGIPEGRIVFDTDAFRADVDEYVTTQRSARETAESRAKLAAKNATLTTPSITAPPTAGGGGAPAKKAAGKITNKQELDDWWESNEL